MQPRKMMMLGVYCTVRHRRDNMMGRVKRRRMCLHSPSPLKAPTTTANSQVGVWHMKRQ